jgi:hypothetical protein
MKTLLLVLVVTLVLVALVIWLSFRAVETIQELAPEWLTPDGKLPPVKVQPRTTRLVPKGTAKKQATATEAKRKRNEFSHLPKFAQRPPLTGSARPERNWIT